MFNDAEGMIGTGASSTWAPIGHHVSMGSMGAPAAAEGKSDELDLAGYLAPTHLNWLDAEPERPWREVEATYVFGDVSGFTALGERLARKGRIGSETLTDAITAVFTAMHEAVSIEGGEILKFGGDAVLAMFTGMRHEARGAAAALGMQDALRAVRIPGIAASRQQAQHVGGRGIRDRAPVPRREGAARVDGGRSPCKRGRDAGGSGPSGRGLAIPECACKSAPGVRDRRGRGQRVLA